MAWGPAHLLFICLSLPAWGWAAQIGQPAPALSLPLLSPAAEGPLDIRDYRGKVVYVDFWASWCGPCHLSFPVLESLQQEFRTDGFAVLAVSVDQRLADAHAFLERYPVSYPVVHDPAGTTPAAYGVLGMPSGYLLDRQGIVRLVHQGFRRGDGEHLREAIMTLLGAS